VAAKAPQAEEVAAFLASHHGVPDVEVEPLAGGFWSAAYGYRAGGRELVVRFGEVREGFEMDRAAMGFAGPDLPVPDVFEVGDALGCSYAISARHYGRFLESVTPADAEAAGPAVERLLAALRAVPAERGAPSAWYPPGRPGPGSTWRAWLAAGLVDDPGHRVHGWRPVLGADPGLDRLFRACELRVTALLDACPERRDLVHGDLLNRNVLTAEDLSRITAVFSWKCSVRGDFLFDVAWCTFWGAWHPGIAAMDVWAKTLHAPSLADSDLEDAALRHHCYELQIAASHLGWNAWTGDHEGLRALVRHTEQVLARGPLPV
jgi:aminoglycoside phosphotransferase (APT) family kinase protein